jgi:DNA-binding beta-propeller fold protein YncE
MAVSPDGATVFVTGISTGASSGLDYSTVAYSAATGAQLCASLYNGPANGDDYAQSVAVSPDGTRVFVTGYSTGTGTGADYATVAYVQRHCAGADA